MPARRLLDEHELAEAGPTQAVQFLPLDLVDPHPDNPRQHYDEIDELAQNIQRFGLLQPILVRRVGDRYVVLGGHRRRAAYLLLRDTEPFNDKWRTIPALIFNAADDEEALLALMSAQLHTKNWRAREEASVLELLVARGYTLKQVGEKVNRTESWASKRLRVYADSVLSGYVQSTRDTPDGSRPMLPASVAEELLTVKDARERQRLADMAVAGDWSQSEARDRVRELVHGRIAEIDQLAIRLTDLLSPPPDDIPTPTARNLWTLYGRIEVISGVQKSDDAPRSRKERFPSIEDAQKAAGVKTQERKLKPGERRKPGLTFRQQQH